MAKAMNGAALMGSAHAGGRLRVSRAWRSSAVSIFRGTALTAAHCACGSAPSSRFPEWIRGGATPRPELVRGAGSAPPGHRPFAPFIRAGCLQPGQTHLFGNRAVGPRWGPFPGDALGGCRLVRRPNRIASNCAARGVPRLIRGKLPASASTWFTSARAGAPASPCDRGCSGGMTGVGSMPEKGPLEGGRSRQSGRGSGHLQSASSAFDSERAEAGDVPLARARTARLSAIAPCRPQAAVLFARRQARPVRPDPGRAAVRRSAVSSPARPSISASPGRSRSIRRVSYSARGRGRAGLAPGPRL